MIVRVAWYIKLFVSAFVRPFAAGAGVALGVAWAEVACAVVTVV